MRRSSCESGFTLLEVVTAVSITVLAFASIHFAAGTAVVGKLLAASAVANAQQGRQAVAWIADRVRQAGFRTSNSAIGRCQDRMPVEPGYLPTASALWINADVDDEGAPETLGFRIETVAGVPAVTETVIPCEAGGRAIDQPITSPTSVRAEALTFRYFDAAGAELTNPSTSAEIRAIRLVTVSLDVEADAGPHGPAAQTWTAAIALRNP